MDDTVDCGRPSAWTMSLTLTPLLRWTRRRMRTRTGEARPRNTSGRSSGSIDHQKIARHFPFGPDSTGPPPLYQHSRYFRSAGTNASLPTSFTRGSAPLSMFHSSAATPRVGSGQMVGHSKGWRASTRMRKGCGNGASNTGHLPRCAHGCGSRPARFRKPARRQPADRSERPV